MMSIIFRRAETSLIWITVGEAICSRISNDLPALLRGPRMRLLTYLGLAVLPFLVLPSISTGQDIGGQDTGGLSSNALSRCAGKVGRDTRQADPAFGIIMLDGMPWMSVERTEEKVGSQPITTTVTSNGALLRHKGTTAYFRFTCLLDEKGEAVMFHMRRADPRIGDGLPAALTVRGTAGYRTRNALPRGAELRVQLLDQSASPQGQILAEQVVRSGWVVPIPFEMRLPKDTSLDGRKLAVVARLVVERHVIFQLAQPHPLTGDAARQSIDLMLDPPT